MAENNIPKVILVFDRWTLGQTGLPAYHVKFACELAKKKKGLLQVYATVVEITPEEKADAEKSGVHIFEPVVRPHLISKPNPDWLLQHESFFPQFTPLKNVRYLVGYNPATADHTEDIRNIRFPYAKVYYVNKNFPKDCSDLESPSAEIEKLVEQMDIWNKEFEATPPPERVEEPPRKRFRGAEPEDKNSLVNLIRFLHRYHPDFIPAFCARYGLKVTITPPPPPLPAAPDLLAKLGLDLVAINDQLEKENLEGEALVRREKEIEEFKEICQRELVMRSRVLMRSMEGEESVKRLCLYHGHAYLRDFKVATMTLHLGFPNFFSLLQFKGKCRMQKFARDLEPKFVTYAMKLEAERLNLPLKLRVSYVFEECRAIEGFFTRRDGGGGRFFEKDTKSDDSDKDDSDSDDEPLTLTEEEKLLLAADSDDDSEENSTVKVTNKSIDKDDGSAGKDEQKEAGASVSVAEPSRTDFSADGDSVDSGVEGMEVDDLALQSPETSPSVKELNEQVDMEVDYSSTESTKSCTKSETKCLPLATKDHLPVSCTLGQDLQLSTPQASTSQKNEVKKELSCSDAKLHSNSSDESYNLSIPLASSMCEQPLGSNKTSTSICKKTEKTSLSADTEHNPVASTSTCKEPQKSLESYNDELLNPVASTSTGRETEEVTTDSELLNSDNDILVNQVGSISSDKDTEELTETGSEPFNSAVSTSLEPQQSTSSDIKILMNPAASTSTGKETASPRTHGEFDDPVGSTSTSKELQLSTSSDDKLSNPIASTSSSEDTEELTTDLLNPVASTSKEPQQLSTSDDELINPVASTSTGKETVSSQTLEECQDPVASTSTCKEHQSSPGSMLSNDDLLNPVASTSSVDEPGPALPIIPVRIPINPSIAEVAMRLNPARPEEPKESKEAIKMISQLVPVNYPLLYEKATQLRAEILRIENNMTTNQPNDDGEQEMHGQVKMLIDRIDKLRSEIMEAHSLSTTSTHVTKNNSILDFELQNVQNEFFKKREQFEEV
ncbi:uncharacterized protein LOC100378040 [Saccoglossus kowalevskii]|uniref:Agglutinin-like protein 6-like n=1 Tax=Saccoglossus kowalevskii TaxID=10224 RepID=A0ABM0GYV2_SACKO|nr:PREDICTED: agglutinin-like protein 6-like [Saccoglossus kowalevskii]